MIDLAIKEFGDFHILINNAGILRDRMIFNITEGEWDAVVELVKELQKDDQENAELGFLLGDSLLKLQHPEQAAAQLEKVEALAQRAREYVETVVRGIQSPQATAQIGAVR